MSSFALRLAALLTMLVDHAGLALFPNIGLFRCVGRLSFPIYCFLIVQGYRHTRSVAAYGRRLALLAILSEIPFDLLIFAHRISPLEQNALFSLLLGLMALSCADSLHTKPLHAAAAVIMLCLFAMAANVSYGWLSIALCLCMHYTCENQLSFSLSVGGALLLYSLTQLLGGVAYSWVLTSLCALFSLPLLLAYNGKPGTRHPALTWMFYTAYPLHIIALVVLRAMRIVPPYFF